MHQTRTKVMKGEKKKKYIPLAWACPSNWKNILGFKEIYITLWSLKYFTYQKEIPKVRASRTSLT